MTFPHEFELAERELAQRLAQFRHDLRAVGDAPPRATLEALVARAAELELLEDEIREELAQLRACLEGLDLKADLLRGELPSVEAPDAFAIGETCHFACPARFGRRRADQFGHLVLSSSALRFRGALDISVVWSEVASVRCYGREIRVTLHDSSRVLRFSCQSPGEAARGGVIAEHLAHAGHPETARTTSPYQASL